MKYQYSIEDAYKILDSVGAEYHIHGTELDVTECPICHGGQSRDKHTFSINTETGLCNCLRGSCGFKGNLIQLARELDYPLLDDNQTAYRQFPKRNKTTPTDRAIKYLSERGISRNVCEAYGITSDKYGRIVFPFYTTTNELTFIKYRNPYPRKGEPKEIPEKNCKPILFGMQNATQYDKPLVITEGQIDALSLAEAGVPNPVSVPMGKNGWKWLNFCDEFIARFSEIIVFGDMENGSMSLVDRLNDEYKGKVFSVQKVDYLGEKDANDILRAYGVDELVRAVNGAKPYAPQALKNLADVIKPDFEGLAKIKTKIRPLDNMIDGFIAGQLILLTGRSGEGKSTLASMFAVRALSQGYNTFIYSGELDDWQVKGWLDSQIAGSKNIEAVQRSSIEEDEDDFVAYSIPSETQEALRWWYDKRCWLYTNENIPERTTEQEYLLEAMKQAALYDNCKFFVIDNMMTVVNELDPDVSAFDTQTGFAKALKNFARKYDVIILLVAHRKKSNGMKGGGDNDFVYGSSNIVNLADMVMTYRRIEEDENGCRGSLELTKNRAYGKLTAEPMKLYYDEPSKRICLSAVEEERIDFDFASIRPIAPELFEMREENNNDS